MAEPPKLKSPHTPSYIPVVAPRPTRSTLPSSLSLPQLQLAALPRRSSGSSPAVGESPLSHNHPQTGISSFRSLRNLLPFGVAKPHPSAGPTNGITNGSKNLFSNFGSVRRSMTSERKNSATFTSREESAPSPVISIQASPQLTDTDTDCDTPAHDSRSSSGDHINFSPGRRSADIKIPALSVSPGPPLGDLSTIIESETSGILKHIPISDDEQELGPKAEKLSTSPRHFQSTAVGAKRSSGLYPDNSYVDTEVGDTSAFDLSTSKLTAEVLDAMMVKDVLTANDWLKGVDGVVVDDVGCSPLKPKSGTLPVGERENNLSFNIGSLDPDLAALLSPNRVDVNDQTMFGVKPPPALSSPVRSPSTSPRRFECPSPRELTRTASPRLPSLTAFRSSDGYFAPDNYPTEVQSSSASLLSTSITRSTSPQKPASLSIIPRLVPVIPASAASFRQGKDLAGSASSSPQSSPEIDDTGPRVSGDHLRRRQPPSPLSSDVSGAGASHNAAELHMRKQSRLIMPARRAASYSSASGGRPPLHHFTTTNSRDADSTILSSGASPSMGTATASKRRLHYPRPNTDEGRTVDDPDRTFQHRARKRSLSFHEDGASPKSTSSYQIPAPARPSSAMAARRPATEWLGPRTAKAFAAAGLLDHEKAGRSSINGSSRYGSTKDGTEQDPRTQYIAPSRMAFSEASGSTSSWGRSRSVSRTLTMSEAGGTLTESPTYSPTPRTTPSGTSTAATSISASSSITQTSLNIIHSMKEKHGIETEALLSALSDSQRATKMLREENMDLRARIQELEGALNHIRRRSVSPQPPAKPLSRMVYQRLSQSSLENGLHRRSQSHMQSQFLHPNHEVISPSMTPERDTSPNLFKETSSQRKRLSTTSSNFPIPPSNMSMLMLEADLAQRSEGLSSRSVSPHSPTLVMPKRGSGLQHSRKRSMSSGGSPMTANFSMTGSPGSLHLRPEHEIHLGDMASLDLAIVGDGSDDDGL